MSLPLANRPFPGFTFLSRFENDMDLPREAPLPDKDEGDDTHETHGHEDQAWA